MKNLTVPRFFWMLFSLNLLLLGIAYMFHNHLGPNIAAFGVYPLGIALAISIGTGVVFAATKPGHTQDRCIWLLALMLAVPMGVIKTERKLRRLHVPSTVHKVDRPSGPFVPPWAGKDFPRPHRLRVASTRRVS